DRVLARRSSSKHRSDVLHSQTSPPARSSPNRVFRVEAHLLHDFFLCGHAPERFVMAMPVDESLALQIRWIVLCIDKKLAQQFRLSAQTLGIFVAREEICGLIAEHGSAAWLQNDDWNACRNLRPQSIQNIQQVCFRLIEKTVIIKGPPATQTALRYFYSIACRFQHFNRGLRGVREEVIVEGIRPEHHSRSIVMLPFRLSGMLREPRFEGLLRECGHSAALRESAERFCDLRQPGRLGKQISGIGKMG